ncbi:PIN domain-like protein [Mycena maculata]|uniref:PIN domain-like protein n=1 Tax=Mycena maculata TaxID=230809 RepID=A0AAD7JKN9_9AGAR|nr:PIN domain-like protein [Mycena maculata]
MGVPKLWEILGPAAEPRSLLNLATIEGFQRKSQGRRTLTIGVDIRQAGGVLNITASLMLEKLFYQLSNFLLAPITFVFIFDGPGRPSVKRGTQVIHRQAEFMQYLKAMIVNFGFHYYEASPSEAELAELNSHGEIDAIITEDSDAFIFGAECLIKSSRSSVQHISMIYTQDSIESTEGVTLGKNDMFLCALLLGGDYHAGVSGAGIMITQTLAAQGFGERLVNILRSYKGSELEVHLSSWRDDLRQELRHNLSGTLNKRHPKLADNIPETFPSRSVSELYLNPLTSRSPQFLGPMPDISSWMPREPNIPAITAFCCSRFGWNGEYLLKKFNTNLWPGVAFKLISSVSLSFVF